MNIYMYLYIWSILMWAVTNFIPQSIRKKFFAITVFVPLFIVLGGRGPYVGTDTPMYNSLFYTLQGLFNGTNPDWNIEYTFVLIANILGLITTESQSIIIFYAFFTILISLILFYNSSYNFFISTIIFIALFYFENFNGMRQCLSVAISYLALFQYIHNKKKEGIVINLIATLIHSSAMLFFLLFLLYPLSKKKIIISVLSFAIIGYITLNYGMDIAFNYFDTSKYGAYFLSSQYGAEKELGAGIIKVVGFVFTILLAALVLYHRNYDDNKQYIYYMILLLIISCVATIMQYQIHIFYRLIYPFAFSFCFLVPLICRYISFNKYLFYFPTLLFLAYYLNRMIENTPDLSYYFF